MDSGTTILNFPWGLRPPDPELKASARYFSLQGDWGSPQVF